MSMTLGKLNQNREKGKLVLRFFRRANFSITAVIKRNGATLKFEVAPHMTLRITPRQSPGKLLASRAYPKKV